MPVRQPFVYPSAPQRRSWSRHGWIVLGAIGISMIAIQLLEGNLSPWLIVWLVVMIGSHGLSTVWPRERQEPSIVISPDGLGGQQVEGAIGTLLPWRAVERLWRDQDAVIVQFQPIDPTSDAPRKRISKVRLFTDGSAGAKTILAEIARVAPHVPRTDSPVG